MADDATTEQGVVERAQIKPGQPGNPGGRAIQLARGMAILEAGALRAAKALVDLIEHEVPTVRLAAIREINDRVYGKPKQQMDVQVTDVAKLHLQFMQEISARRDERMRTIEGNTHKPEVHDPSKLKE